MSINVLFFLFCIICRCTHALTVEGIPAPVLDIFRAVRESATLEDAAEQVWGQQLSAYSKQLTEQIRQRYSPDFQSGITTDEKCQCLNYLYLTTRRNFTRPEEDCITTL